MFPWNLPGSCRLTVIQSGWQPGAAAFCFHVSIIGETHKLVVWYGFSSGYSEEKYSVFETVVPTRIPLGDTVGELWVSTLRLKRNYIIYFQWIYFRSDSSSQGNAWFFNSFCPLHFFQISWLKRGNILRCMLIGCGVLSGAPLCLSDTRVKVKVRVSP